MLADDVTVATSMKQHEYNYFYNPYRPLLPFPILKLNYTRKIRIVGSQLKIQPKTKSSWTIQY